MKMNTKKLVLNSVLLGIGLVLHQIEPAIFGVKPDMTLIMLFSVMILNKDTFELMLKEKYGDEYTFLEPFKKSTVGIMCRHNVCGSEFKKIPYELIKRGSGCPVCSKKDANKK